jgi:hypothetical protein
MTLYSDFEEEKLCQDDTHSIGCRLSH